MEISITETVGLIYILIGIAIWIMAHVKSHASAYEEKGPVIFRLAALKRWFRSKFEQVIS